MKRILTLLASLALLLTGCVNMEFVPSYRNHHDFPSEDATTVQTDSPSEPSLAPGTLRLERYLYEEYEDDLYDLLELRNECDLMLRMSDPNHFADDSQGMHKYSFIYRDERVEYGGDHFATYSFEITQTVFFAYRSEDGLTEIITDEDHRIRYLSYSGVDMERATAQALSTDEIKQCAEHLVSTFTGSNQYQMQEISGGINQDGHLIHIITFERIIDYHRTKDTITFSLAPNGEILEVSTGISYRMFDDASEFPFVMLDVQALMREKAGQDFTYGYYDLGAEYFYMKTFDGKTALWIEISAMVYDNQGQEHELRDVWIAHFGD